MTSRPKQREGRASLQGFSLIEVTLALLVVGVGVLSVVGLFGSGLDAGRKSYMESQIMSFADDVFNGYRLMSLNPISSSPCANNFLSVPADTNTYSWNNFSALRLPVRMFMKSSPVTSPGINKKERIVYSSRNRYSYTQAGTVPADQVEYAFWYQLQLLDPVPPNPRIKILKLTVWDWPSETSAPPPTAEPYFFYTELYDFAM